MFATDRDLLILEPALFASVAWTAQRLLSGAGDIDGTTLTLTTHDHGLLTQNITAGHVARVGAFACEIVAVTAEDTAQVSRPRPGPDAEPIAITPMTGVPVDVFTFAPQLADAHRRVLRMLGLHPLGEAPEGEPDETAVTNPRDLARLEALGALHLIYAGASAGLGEHSPAALRAESYRARFAAERGAVVARIDTDGDGEPDTTRRPGLARLIRA